MIRGRTLTSRLGRAEIDMAELFFITFFIKTVLAQTVALAKSASLDQA